MHANTTILRAVLPTPDAVIVHHGGGSFTVVADLRLSESYVDQVVADIPGGLGNPTHSVG